MQVPIHFQTGDEDDSAADILPARKLYLAVFHRAIADLLGGNKFHRIDAWNWFTNKDAEDSIVSFQTIKEIFNFKSSRLKKLHLYIFETNKYEFPKLKGGNKYFRIVRRRQQKD